LRPTTGPKSIVSLSAGLRACGNGSAATMVPTRMSTARNWSKSMVSATGWSGACETCMHGLPGFVRAVAANFLL
jgi:hypothetical protein